MAAHPLDGDGIAFNLFNFLKSRLDDKPLTFKVPDTIIFHNFPTTWYYWAYMPLPDEASVEEEGEQIVKRRNGCHKENCISGEVREKAGKHLEKSNIIQSFVKMQTNPVCDIIASFYQRDSDGLCSVEFMNAEELDTFLNSQHTGILQSFVMPRTDFNDMIQVVWSPKVCHVSRRTNRHKLYEKGPTRYEKALTYEGWSAHSEEDKIGPAAQAKVKKVCQKVVEHLSGTDHRYRIARMVLYMKEDRNHPNVMWLLYSTSFRFVEVRYNEPTRAISFSPPYKTPPSQALRKQVEMPVEMAEARVKPPPSLCTSKTIGNMMADMPEETRDALGTMILQAFHADPALPSCVLSRGISPSRGVSQSRGDGDDRRSARQTMEPLRAVTPPPTGRRSPTGSVASRPHTSPKAMPVFSPVRGQEAEATLAKKLAARQAKRMQKLAASQRREADSCIAEVERRHQATAERHPELTPGKGVFAGLVAHQQEYNEKLWRQVQAMQEAVEHMRHPVMAASTTPRLKDPHRPLPAVRGRPPHVASPSTDQQSAGGGGSGSAVKGLSLGTLPFLNKSGGYDKPSGYASVCSSPRSNTVKVTPLAQQPLFLLKQLHSSVAYKKVSKSIKTAREALRRRNLRLIEEFEDQVDWATVGLTAAAAQVHWPETRTVYESIPVPRLIHEVLQEEESRGMLGTLLFPMEKFQRIQEAKRQTMNLAPFPSVNFVVNVSPPRDLWYGEELKKRKKKATGEPEAKSPHLDASPPELQEPPTQPPVSPTNTSVAAESPSDVDAPSDASADTSQEYVTYGVSLPDKKMGLGTMDALKRHVREVVEEADAQEERQVCEDLLSHMYAAKKAGLLQDVLKRRGSQEVGEGEHG
eukprot:GGOE01041871.1.p1 GENE.GGOE01041871.1~~GGOE01041871.1.p1  ORF type:complete len:874 (-),score=207.87 GGOE01041871.1:549-3143(-)